MRIVSQFDFIVYLFMTSLFLLLLFILLTTNGFVAGGSGTAIRHNTQNNTPHSNKTQHTKLQKP
jgi:hypothetical protein